MSRRDANGRSGRGLLRAGAALATLATLVGGSAFGAGLSRPNVVGARAIGMGGAFTAVADDPTAVWYNPAGTAIYGDNVAYVGGELAFLGRTYTPDANSPLGQAGINYKLTENTAPTLLPVIGFTTRFGLGKNAPTRFAFSLAAYDAYGGNISYSAAKLTPPGATKPDGITSIEVFNYEVAPTLAYQVNDFLALGAGLRIGINQFSINDTEVAFSGKPSGSGAGIGGTLGAMIKPYKLIQIGLTYRTPMSVALSGTSPLGIGSAAPTPRAFNAHVDWPQSASIGVAIQAHARLLISVQADWTGWSSVQQLKLTIPSLNNVSQAKTEDYTDSYAVHLGFQGIVTRWLLLRFGATMDSSAIPAATQRRENQDTDKVTLAGGFGLHFWRLFIDAAFEGLIPGNQYIRTPTPTNETGLYRATIYSAELSAQIRF